MTDPIEIQSNPPNLVHEAFMRFATKYPMRLVPTSTDVHLVHRAKFNGVTVLSAPSPDDDSKKHDFTPETVQAEAERVSVQATPSDAPPRPTFTTEVWALSPFEVAIDASAGSPAPQQVDNAIEMFCRSILPAANPDKEVTVMLGASVSSYERTTHNGGKKWTVLQFHAAFEPLPNIPHAVPLLILHRLSEHCDDYYRMVCEKDGADDQTPERFRKRCAATASLIAFANPKLGELYVPTDLGNAEMSKFMTCVFDLFRNIGRAVDPRGRQRA